MPGNAIAGDIGEQDVIAKIVCPNCSRALMLLPKSYPLFDVQCVGCLFRAQIKTNNSKPKPEILGAGWEIISKSLKAGYLAPPLIANFVWTDRTTSQCHQEIHFYPFIPKRNLRVRVLSVNARRAGYKMFNYTGIDQLPHFVLYAR